MDFFNKLIQQANEPEIDLNIFIMQYSNQRNEVFLFFEGNDDESFYINFIDNLLPKGFSRKIYHCKGKEKVYDNFSQLDWTYYNKNRILFFVDKDFSDILSKIYPIDSNIYVTDYYSIENYLVSEYMIERMFKEFCHEKESRVDIFKLHFIKQLEEFYKLMLMVISWIIYLRESNSKANINNIKLSNIFHFVQEQDSLQIKKKISDDEIFKYLDTSTGFNTPPNAHNSISNIHDKLKTIPEPKTYIRGKYELWFLVEYYLRLINCINSSNIGFKLNNKININHDNAIKILGSKILIPNSLENFLKYNFSNL